MTDEHFMEMALDLARMALGQTSPNPVVGAVLVKDGAVVGVGAHLAAGEPHAEVHALRMAGDRARGATLYVTLEPCSHHGRTPPCADAVVAAGVSRVVVAVEDPSPWVAGSGLARLRGAGIDVAVGCLGPRARRDNAAYLHYAHSGLPYVTLKLAATLDGFIAASNGESRHITGVEARNAVHELRRRVDAVFVGVGTVLQDDPALTARPAGLPERGRTAFRQPLRVVADSRLRTPADAQIVRDKTAETLLACSDEAPADREQELAARGAQIVRCPDGRGGVDLEALLRVLAARGCRHVLVEGGGILAAALLDRRLVSEVWFFHAPRLLGNGVPALAGKATTSPGQGVRLCVSSTARVGDDYLTVGTPDYGEDADCSRV